LEVFNTVWLARAQKGVKGKREQETRRTENRLRPELEQSESESSTIVSLERRRTVVESEGTLGDRKVPSRTRKKRSATRINLRIARNVLPRMLERVRSNRNHAKANGGVIGASDEIGGIHDRR